MFKQREKNNSSFRRLRHLVGAGFFVLLLTTVSLSMVLRPAAEAATANSLNFQARLMQANGALVPDGFYNVQFKLYNVSSAGSALWTETYYDSNGATAGNDNRVRVVNGYVTVNLNTLNNNWGSITSWDQELWLTMNIGGVTQTATPTWDGEMNPRLKLTAVPYAFQAKNAEGLNKTTGVNTSTLSWANQTAANAILLPDAAGTVCLQGNAACGFMTGSAGDYIQNGTAPQTANLNITGSATVGSLLTSSLDTASAGTLTLGGTNATSIIIADSATISAGLSLTITGGATGTRPASPAEGMMYFDTTTKQLLTYSNGKWQADKSDAILVAASDSSQADKDAAQYIADGDTAAAADGDQVQINQALAAGAGKKVVLLAGTYTADATILVPNNTALAGVGTGTLIKLADIDATDNLIENSDTTTGTGVIIRDLKLDGQKSLNTAGTQRAVYLDGMGDGTGSTARQGAELAGLSISEFRNEGIYLNNSDGLTLRSNVLQSSGVAIYVASSSNNALTGNTVLGGDVTLTASTNNSLAGNVVTGGRIRLLSSSGKNTATGNVIRGATGDGFVINGSADNTVTGNVMESNGQAGIYLTVAVGNTITGNSMTENGNFGVYATSTSTDNTISGNKISGNYYGIYISNNSARNLLSGNTITNNGNSIRNQAIVLEDADMNTIDGNAISDTSATTTNDAIEIRNSTSDNNYLSNNTLGTGSINDAGTGTIYANQINSSGVLINRSSGGMAVQNTSGQNLISASPSGNTVQLGQSSALSGSLIFANATNNNTVKIQSGTTSASYSLTLPAALGASGSCLADTTGTGVLGFTTCGGGGGVTTIGALDGGTANANGATITGGTIYLQSASATNAGLINTTTQTISGAKTFNNTITIATNQSLVLNGGVTGSRPATPAEGTVFFDTTTKQLLTYSNGKWQADSKTATFVVAAFDSTQAAKDAAHYVVASVEDSNGAGAGNIDGAQIKINEALNAAEALGGGIVYLQEGTYTIDATIAIPNRVTLAGAGAASVIRLGDFGAITTNIDAITNKDVITGDRVMIRDVLLDGRAAINTSGTQRGFYLSNVGGGNGATFREGVTVLNVLAKNFLTNNGRITASKYGKVTNSSFVSSEGTGFVLDSLSSDMLIENSIFDSNGWYGLHISSSSNNVFSGNTITNNTDRGVIVFSPATGNKFNGNTIKSNTNIGMQLQGVALSVISDNTITDNSGVGIVLTATSTHNVVSNNAVSGNLGSYGIRVENTSDYNQVIGNNLRDSGTATNNNAITISNSDYTTIINNAITDSSATTNNYAIWVGTSTADNTYLSNNTLGGGTIADVGTGTIYMNQLDSSGMLLNRSSGGFAVQSTTGTDILNISSAASTVAVSGTLDVQAGSASALAVKNTSGDALFKVDTANNQVVVGNASGAPTLFVLGNKSTDGDPATGTNGAMYYNSFMNQFRCYVNGAWAACAGSGTGGGSSSRTVVLVPEYAGGTLQADGTSNAGVMNADFVSGLSSGQGYKHNYYQWTSSNTASQDYNIVVNTALPSEFASGFTDLKIWGYSSSTSLATATIQLYDQDGTACYGSPVSLTPSTASTWEQKTVGAPTGCTFAANDIITIIVVVNAEDNEVFRVGEISFSYTN